MVDSIKYFISGTFYTPKTEDWYKYGYITAQQFIEAGDMLKQFGWKWGKASNPKKKSKYLPDEKKQYLYAEGRSAKRIKDIMKMAYKEEIVDGFILTSEVPNDKDKQSNQSGLTTESCRKYVFSITYDSYYHCPRMWLTGCDEDGKALTQSQIFEDITSEHQNETVTFEDHPHLDVKQVTIHPCKHAERFKDFIDEAKSKGKDIKPNMALVLFLKFMTSIMPTVEYDCTADIDLYA